MSMEYLQKKQNETGVVSLINDKICYNIIKPGTGIGIECNKIYDLRINFTVKDTENNLLAGNYALSEPLSCTLSELIPGMAYGMLGMHLNEIREIYIHPEFAYGAFSNFGNGRALLVRVELVESTPTDAIFYPCCIPVDLVKFLKNQPGEVDMSSLERAYIFFCGKASWSFYRHRLSHLHLDDVLSFLQLEDSATVLSPEDREILYKLQWLIYKSGQL